MVLTDQQNDALVEVINIAFARAAAALSDLTGSRVLIEVPQVVVLPIKELPAALASLIQGDVATVHQIFSGPMSGDAFLLLDYESAVTLAGLLTEERVSTKRLDMSDQEVLTEVGNILLNACLGMFGNLLEVHISFSVPRMQLDSLSTLLESLTIGTQDLRYALVIATTFRLQDSAVGGHIVIVLGVASLDRLMQAIEDLG